MSRSHVRSPGLFLTFIEMEMDTTGMGILVISVYRSYGAVLFEGVLQLKLFPET